MEKTEMKEDIELEADPAAEAFGRLEREMALMRRAVEHLATERADIVIPDYNPTLVKITANLASLDKCLREIEEKPALLETPEDFGQRIAAAARSARGNDEEIIRQWEKATDRLESKLINALGCAATLGEQQQRERWIYGLGAAAATFLMTFLPGVIARELPSSWQLPERMARRVVDEPSILDAGVHLIKSADPQLWDAIEEAAALADANPEAIKRCKAAARKTKRPVSCQVRVDR